MLIQLRDAYRKLGILTTESFTNIALGTQMMSRCDETSFLAITEAMIKWDDVFASVKGASDRSGISQTELVWRKLQAEDKRDS